MAISETKGQGWKVIRTQWRKASNPGRLFIQQPHKKGIERLI